MAEGTGPVSKIHRVGLRYAQGPFGDPSCCSAAMPTGSRLPPVIGVLEVPRHRGPMHAASSANAAVGG